MYDNEYGDWAGKEEAKTNRRLPDPINQKQKPEIHRSDLTFADDEHTKEQP